MPDAPFFEFPLLPEMKAELEKVRVRERARILMIFAKVRKLVLPTDARQRLEQLDASALEALIDLTWTEPEAAAAALLAATQPRNS